MIDWRFSSFVESHGQPLLDLSLYVSSQNYTEITRPLYNKIQPFPLPYLTPPAVRAAAKIRTEHLGLSSLDIDTEDNDASTEPSIIPQSLRRPRQTVSSMLASAPETNAQIRLDALATDFFEPMQALRRKKQFFVSDSQFSSLDCLALGYMALMLTPELPQPWLAKTMQAKFPGLCKWTEELKVEVYGKERTTLEDASPVATTDADLDARLKRLRGRGHLPWMPPYNRDAISVGSVFLSSLAGSIPVVGQLSKNTRTKQHGKPSQNETQGTSWQYWGLAGSLITTLGLVGGYMFQQGLLSLPGEKPEKQRSVGLGAFGEAGEALGLYANQLDAAAQQQRMLEQSQGEPIVEIEVERDGISSTERLS